MQRFYDWAVSAGGISPSTGYRGTNPLNSIINAFCDPAIDPVTGDQYFYGGGHGDGSCNAVVRLRMADMSWSVAVPPTPPGVYLPNYMVSTADITYPSGALFSGPSLTSRAGWFLTEAQGLNATTDAGFVAPAPARVSTHMYGAAVYRSSSKTCHYFYNGYGACNVETGLWLPETFAVNIPGQLGAIQSNLNATLALQWGTQAIFDTVTDRAYFTLIGGGFRNHIVQFNCATHTVDSIHGCPVQLIGNASPIVQVGRKLWVFRISSNTTGTANSGAIFDLDAKTWQVFTLSGTLSGQVTNTVQESMPCWWDSRAQRIRRWNYNNATDKSMLFTIDPSAPVSGAGTVGDPTVFDQTTVSFSVAGGAWFPGTANQQIMYLYHRAVFSHAANAVVLVPRSDITGTTGKAWALRLA